MNMNERIAKLAEAIPEELDGVLIEDPISRRYFAKFPSTAGCLLVFRNKAIFFIDSRYFEAASSTIKGCEVVRQDKVFPQLMDCLAENSVKNLGILSDWTTLRRLHLLEEKLPGILISQDDRLGEFVAGLRQQKDESELASIRRAQKITDDTFSHILNYIKPGLTERQIALEMEFYSRRKGSEEAAFSFIVVSGPNSSRPHGVPGDRQVGQGDFITMDFGAVVDGYRSDMTRTVAVGSVSDRQRLVYDTVLKAQAAGLKAVRAGVRCGDVDAAARGVIEAAGFGAAFGHSLGHSLGLEIHETPNFAPDSKDITRVGNVMSVEPGIYLPGEFGVRIEDIVAVTQEGCENLTNSAKNLIIL